ncbi:MAG TPA: hypothetical protein VLE95_05975 [Chlamydiales bacterium]|nr:hypothetical protein [Chlamydiales bacterium]
MILGETGVFFANRRILRFATAFFLFVLFAQPLSAMQKKTRPHSLGVRTVEYFDVSRNRPLLVEIWYPTTKQKPLDTPVDEMWIHPQEVRNAPFIKEMRKAPLLLISHGYKGGRRDISWLADIMVQAGYIVAAVDHYGDTRCYFDPRQSVCFWNRPLDCMFLLNQLSRDERMREKIDFDRIGFIGYSLGGMTGLALAGGQAKDLSCVIKSLSDHKIEPKHFEGFDFSIAEKSYKESRVKAMLLLCPAFFIYGADSFKQIQIPIGLVAAMGDEVLPFREHAYQVIQHLSPIKLKLFREEISHYAFMNRVSESGKKILKKALHTDPPCCERLILHQEVGEFAVDFFRSAL